MLNARPVCLKFHELLKGSLVLLALAFSSVVAAQEICNNGIDDDGDLLVDVNDPDCDCAPRLLLGIIPNPSFEDTSCCPTMPGQMQCVNNWTQGGDATPDYFNVCGYDGVGGPPPQFPLTDEGAGWVGGANANIARDFIATCLTNPMTVGTTYDLSISSANHTTTTPLDLTIYGTPDCNDLGWTGNGCPIGQGSWQVIGSTTVSYSAAGQWSIDTIVISPSININAIAFGPPCATGIVSASYYFFDDLRIVLPNTPTTINESGGWCTNDLLLAASNATAGGTWQWYQDGIALAGETTDTLNLLPYGGGNFAARYYYPESGCTMAYDTVVLPLNPDANFSLEVACGTTMVDFTDSSSAVAPANITAYNWSFGDGNNSNQSDPNHTYVNDGSYTIELIVVDDNSCRDTATQMVSVANTPLLVTALPSLNVQCSGDVPAANPAVVNATGTGMLSVMHLGDVTDNNACPETIIRTYRVIDVCDTLTVSQTIVVHDTIAPQAVAPMDVTVDCASDIPPVNTALVTGVSDNCTAAPIVAFVGEVVTGSSCNQQVITRTYSVTDACSNVTQLSHQITVSAFIPVVEAGNDTAVCEGNSIALIASTSAGVTFNWNGGVNDGVSFTPPAGVNTYVLTANQCAGQCVAQDTVVVTVWENPTSNFNLAVACGTTTVDFTDNASAAAPASISNHNWGFGDGNTSNQSDPTHSYINDGNYTIELVVVDDNLCVDTSTQMVSVANTPLLIDPLPTLNMQCVGDVPAADPTLVNATGTGAISVTHLGDASDNNTCPETISRTYRVIDACDTIIVSQAIVVNDTLAPQAIAPLDVTVDCTSDIPPVNTALVTGVSDNCTASPVVAFVGEVTTGSSCNQQVITRTYSVTDACNNVTQLSHQITVSAFIPTVEAGNDTAVCDGSNVVLLANTTAGVTFDWNGGVNDGESFAPPAEVNSYVVTAEQCAGQCIARDTIVVTVWENPTASFSPVIACGTTSVDFDNNSTAVAPASISSHAWSFGDGNTSNQSDPSHTYLNDSSYSIELVVVDANSCADTATQMITVANTPLLADALTMLNVQCAGDVPMADTTVVNVTGTGALSVVHVSDVSTGVNCPEILTRTYRVTDACGTLDVLQEIVIHDTIAPLATAPQNVVVDCSEDIPLVDFTSVTGISDNCTANPVVSLFSETSTGSPCNSQIITRIYEVADACGNSTLVSQQITVTAEAPVFGAGADTTLCEGDSLVLTAFNPTNFNLEWSHGISNGVSFVPPVGNNNFVVTAALCGAQCSASDTIVVVVNPAPTIDLLPRIDICEGDTARLETSSGGILNWNNGATDSSVYFVSLLADQFITLSVSDSATTCTSIDSVLVDVHGFPFIDNTNLAIIPATCLVGGSLVGLVASDSTALTYEWFDSNDQLVENRPDLSDANAGDYLLAVTNTFGCSSVLALTVPFSDLAQTVQALADTLQVVSFLPQQIDVALNDVGDETTVAVTQGPWNGVFSNLGNGQLEYAANFGFSGTDSLVYVICDAVCVDSCAEATLYVLIEDRPDVIIYNGVSANGDGLNDAFTIENLQYFPDNELQIMNRWGDVIYQKAPYDNTWTGESNSGKQVFGDRVVDGTYFYFLNLGDGSETKSGYIELRSDL